MLLRAVAAVFAVAVLALLCVPLLLGGASGACSSAASASGPLDFGRSIVVGASEYGGPGDPGSGTSGYRDDVLSGRLAFAELSHGAGDDYSALGNLPHGTRLRITVTIDGQQHSVVAEKLDIGSGGADVQGHPRAIDLWWQTANALGLPGTAGTWTGLVHIQRTRAPAGTVETSTACAATTTPAGPLAQRIVAIARGELAKHVSEPGNNCVRYNHCDGQPWCASFLSYVWQHAGVPMPFTEASNMVWTWASQHAQVLPPTARPQPGDAILYGSGPESTATSVHIGIVETVLPDGRITTIEGNYGNRVSHNGPFHPSEAAAEGEPAPVYAYARPTR